MQRQSSNLYIRVISGSEPLSSLQKMGSYHWNAPAVRANNTTGAVIFVFYMLFALLLTFLIVASLCRSYTSLPIPKRPSKRASILALVSTISFVTLSWHMSSFLVFSYLEWAEELHLPPPDFAVSHFWSSKASSFQIFLQRWEAIQSLQLWRWATSSTLFRDFAVEIQTEELPRWWTSLVLWWELGISWWMAVQGEQTYLYYEMWRKYL